MLSWAAAAGLAAVDLQGDGFSWLFVSVLVVAATVVGCWFPLLIRDIRAQRREPSTLSIVVSMLWIPLCIGEITLNVAFLRRDGFTWDHLSLVAGYSLLLGAWPTAGILDFLDRRSNQPPTERRVPPSTPAR